MPRIGFARSVVKMVSTFDRSNDAFTTSKEKFIKRFNVFIFIFVGLGLM